jgi:hypothetical protein
MRDIIPREFESRVIVGSLPWPFSPESNPVAYAKQIETAADALWDDFLHDLCMSKTWYDTGSNTYVEPSAALRKSLCKGSSAVEVTQDKPKASADLRNSYMTWKQAWKTYYNENVNITFPSPQRDDLNKWYAQLTGYYNKFKESGAVTITPPLISPIEAEKMTPESGIGKFFNEFPWGGLLAVAGIFGVVYILRETRTERAAIMPSQAPKELPAKR